MGGATKLTRKGRKRNWRYYRENYSGLEAFKMRKWGPSGAAESRKIQGEHYESDIPRHVQTRGVHGTIKGTRCWGINPNGKRSGGRGGVGKVSQIFRTV